MRAYQLHIRNMVCDRCIYVVRQLLKQLKVVKPEVELGRVSFFTNREKTIPLLEKRLNELGLPVIENHEELLLESIRLEVEKYFDALEKKERVKKFSDRLQRRLGKNYYYLSKFFRDHEQMTLEAYVIQRKTERVKSLIRENELSLKEISERLHYSSFPHLSAQFLKVMGCTITEFRKKLHEEYAPDSITEVLGHLKSRGFIHHFTIEGRNLSCLSLSKKSSLKEAKVREVYRFEEKQSRYGNSAIFEVETNDGLKGFLICQ